MRLLARLGAADPRRRLSRQATLTLAEARTALPSSSGNGAGPTSGSKANDPALAIELIEQIADYRARVAGEHQAIRLAKVQHPF